jgi:PAS domain S-box-containing protein
MSLPGIAPPDVRPHQRFARLAARVAGAPAALFAAPGSAVAVSCGAPESWGNGWEGALAARLLAHLRDARAELLVEHASGLLPVPVACAAVPVCAPSGRVLGVVAALDAGARAWAADAGEQLRDVAELAAASLGEDRGAEGWRYRWLAGEGGASVLLGGRPGGGTSSAPVLRTPPVEGAQAAGPPDRALLEAAPLPTVALDPEGNVTLWNPAAERELGWTAAEALGRPFPLVPPPLWPELLAFLAGALAGTGADAHPAGRPPAALEVLGRRRNGSPAEVSIVGAAFRNGGGAACGVLVQVVDVTERRVNDREREQLLILEQAARARAELAERRSSVLAYASELLHAAFDSTPDALRGLVSSLAHLVVPSLADYCRIDVVQPDGSVARTALVHTGPAALEPPDSFPAEAPADAHPALRVIRTGEPVMVPEVGAAHLVELFASARERNALPDRMRSLLVVPLGARGRTLGALTLATGGSRRRYGREDLVFAHDMARRIALELDNVRLFRQAETAARLRDEVLAVVSHDLRNPLSVISFSSDVLLRAWASETERAAERRQLEGIALSTQRMRRLIDDLLDVARVDAGRMSVEPCAVPAGRLVLDALESHAPLAEARAILTRVRLPAEIPPVLADADRVLQVFSNLLGNAIRFTPRGGGITLSVGVEERAVRFAVSDTGPGIPDEHLPHIFDRFWRAQRARREGAGLGLAIARGIVEAHEGRIWAESVPGEGSTFHFTLPRADAAP